MVDSWLHHQPAVEVPKRKGKTTEKGPSIFTFSNFERGFDVKKKSTTTLALEHQNNTFILMIS